MSDVKNFKINDDDLDNVSGGALFDAAGVAGSDPNNRFEVINNTDNIIMGKYKKGDVVGRYDNPGEAAQAARDLGLSDTFIGWDELKSLRGN